VQSPEHQPGVVAAEKTVDEPVGPSAVDAGPAEQDFACPRCGRPVTLRFYGPCPDCVKQLRSEVAGEAAEVTAPDYEPKMNVTPNAVALKED